MDTSDVNGEGAAGGFGVGEFSSHAKKECRCLCFFLVHHSVTFRKVRRQLASGILAIVVCLASNKLCAQTQAIDVNKSSLKIRDPTHLPWQADGLTECGPINSKISTRTNPITYQRALRSLGGVIRRRMKAHRP